jgi:hypothetical protein
VALTVLVHYLPKRPVARFLLMRQSRSDGVSGMSDPFDVSTIGAFQKQTRLRRGSIVCIGLQIQPHAQRVWLEYGSEYEGQDETYGIFYHEY